jgi:uncharacterized membrane protein YeaQ/YmgE (transglycosylase-associated protein family)
MGALGTLLTWLFAGSAAGCLAHLALERFGASSAGDMGDDSIVGMVGAFVCGFVQSLLLPGAFSVTGFNLMSLLLTFIATAITSALLLVLLMLVKRALSLHRAL